MPATDTEGTALLTIPEAARQLRCSRATVYRYIEQGALHPVRVTPKSPFRIPAAEVERIATGSAA